MIFMAARYGQNEELGRVRKWLHHLMGTSTPKSNGIAVIGTLAVDG